MRPPRDTTPDAWARQVEAYRAIGPDGRLRLASELSEDVLAIARDGIRHAHPDWSDALIDAELGRRLRRERADRPARP